MQIKSSDQLKPNLRLTESHLLSNDPTYQKDKKTPQRASETPTERIKAQLQSQLNSLRDYQVKSPKFMANSDCDYLLMLGLLV